LGSSRSSCSLWVRKWYSIWSCGKVTFTIAAWTYLLHLLCYGSSSQVTEYALCL
jgi:hypothetical protein